MILHSTVRQQNLLIGEAKKKVRSTLSTFRIIKGIGYYWTSIKVNDLQMAPVG